MVLLFRSSYFDVRNYVDAAREANTAVCVDASDVVDGRPVDDGQGSEIALKRAEAVLEVFFVSIAS